MSGLLQQIRERGLTVQEDDGISALLEKLLFDDDGKPRTPPYAYINGQWIKLNDKGEYEPYDLEESE